MGTYKVFRKNGVEYHINPAINGVFVQSMRSPADGFFQASIHPDEAAALKFYSLTTADQIWPVDNLGIDNDK